MTDAPKQPDAKLDALLASVIRHRDEQCRAIDEDAEDQAQAIVMRAYQDARTKVHDVIFEERRSVKRAIDKQHARIETAKRQNLQDTERAFLDAGWQQLMTALRRRWNDDASRRDWVAGVVDLALAHLHPGSWRVEHPLNWPPAELEPFLEQILSFSGDAPRFESAPDLEVGIRITANGAMVDASLKGVTADREEISAMLLAQLFQDAKEQS